MYGIGLWGIIASSALISLACAATSTNGADRHSTRTASETSEAPLTPAASGEHFAITTALRVRDPRIVPNHPRAQALLVSELQSLDRLSKNSVPNSPDYPALLLRLANTSAELALSYSIEAKSTLASSARRNAIEYYKNLEKADANYASRALYFQAFEHELSGNISTARALYFELIKKYPKAAQVPLCYLAFGELFLPEAELEPSKRDLAESAYREVLKYPPSENRGHCYAQLRLAELRREEEEFTRAIACVNRHPDLPESANILARAESGERNQTANATAVAAPLAPTTIQSVQVVPPSDSSQTPLLYKANEPRIALIIGNAHYDTSPLANPINDAEAMASTLRSLSFEVTLKTDADQKSMKNAIRDFGQRLRITKGVGLFFFAGHGMQVNGENYLVPVRAPIDVEADVAVEAVALGSVLAKMDGAQNRLNLVILDACRNNPFARSFRSDSRGLALTDAPMGTYISYATAPGRVAADGSGSHGVFTGAILKHITIKGKSTESLFMAVRSDVVSATGGRQMPWASSSLTTEFYFAGN